MVTTHNLGFPRIGAKRELKFAQEGYWKGQSSRDELTGLGAQLRQRHWENQAGRASRSATSPNGFAVLTATRWTITSASRVAAPRMIRLAVAACKPAR